MQTTLRTTQPTASDSFSMEQFWRPSVLSVIRASRGPDVRIEETARRVQGQMAVADKAIQKRVGDFTEVRAMDGAIVAYHEAKIEERASRNLFLETWSNCAPEGHRAKEGWLTSCQADVLWYGFIETMTLHEIDWTGLRAWLLSPHPTATHPLGIGHIARIDTYVERAQAKTRQKNTTVARLVPLRDIEAAGFVRATHRLEHPDACRPSPSPNAPTRILAHART